MTDPTSIPETPMAHSNFKPLLESKDSSSPRSIEVRPHVLQKLLDIKEEEENQCFAKWMK